MDEGSDPKATRRKRVSRACDRCRSKKDKCDGLRPACSACQASGHTCSYDPQTKKRGLPEGYVRGLEKLWALSICNIDGFEDTMLTLLGTTAESACRRDKLMNLWTDDVASETLHDSWKTSRLYNALEKMLSNPDSSPSHRPEKRSREDVSDFSLTPESEWGFRVDRRSTPSLDAGLRVKPSAVYSDAKRARLSHPLDNLSLPFDSGTRVSLELPTQTSQLLDIYFAVTHSWFPIVAKHNILRASYLYANAPLSVTKTAPGSGNHATLWALLSYTISQSTMTSPGRSSESIAKTREYYSVSLSLIPSEADRYELGHVQALLLLTLVNIGLEDWTTALLLSGQAVRMAISMGLGAPTDFRLSEERRQGKVVFLGCFVIDSLLSFRMSRRPCMHPRDLASVGLLEEDGLEEWNSWTDILPPAGTKLGNNPPRRGPLLALSCFNRLVELASVLNKISRDAITGVSAHIFAQQLVLELKQWDERLPLGCRLISPESIYPERHSALLPHQTYLCLTYLATLLWLYLRMASYELEMHRSQRAAIEGAKNLLFRALPMISQHIDNFRACGLPPLFEFSLWTLTEQALTLRSKVKYNMFPFGRWVEALLQQTMQLKLAWPIYRTLARKIDYWYHCKDLPETLSYFRSSKAENTPRVAPSSPNNDPFVDTMPTAATCHRDSNTEASVAPQNPPTTSDSSYTSAILGISVPVEEQYMTSKDRIMENTDLCMLDLSFQQQQEEPPLPRDRTTVHEDKSDLAHGLDAMLPPEHPLSTPDSSVSKIAMTGKSTSNDRPLLSNNSEFLDHDSSSKGDLSAPGTDIDSIFKDLAYLDTTEWAISREAGLKEFGFIDDSTFHAFCHDPDRLAESQSLVHPPSFEDIWPPPGFFPETFQDSAEDAMEV